RALRLFHDVILDAVLGPARKPVGRRDDGVHCGTDGLDGGGIGHGGDLTTLRNGRARARASASGRAPRQASRPGSARRRSIPEPSTVRRAIRTRTIPRTPVPTRGSPPFEWGRCAVAPRFGSGTPRRTRTARS